MAQRTILITGASGEIGHGLIKRLAESGRDRILALDLHAPEDELRTSCYRFITGDIADNALLENLAAAYDFDAIYHLAALLSTKSERQPRLAHRVNVDGTLNVLELGVGQARQQGREIKFLYPSSVAVYGLPDLDTKDRAGRVREDDWCEPRTMYGINKLYCERLGRYYARYYRQLDVQETAGRLDFRGLRFPGLISADTVPTGGTSDFAAEMLHAAAARRPYACFVREDSRIPFMAMPDAVESLLKLEAAPRQQLTREVYNVGSFNPSAGELADIVRRAFSPSSRSRSPARARSRGSDEKGNGNGVKGARIRFAPDPRRQAIVDSWPVDVDDSAARADWGWQPMFDLARAFDDYLVPAVRQRYREG